MLFSIIFSTLSGFIVVVFIFETYLEWRQYRSFLTSKLPSELKGVVGEEKFEKSQDYGRAKM